MKSKIKAETAPASGQNDDKNTAAGGITSDLRRDWTFNKAETAPALAEALRKSNALLQGELARASERGLEVRWEPLRKAVEIQCAALKAAGMEVA
jgi:hypothetical protein